MLEKLFSGKKKEFSKSDVIDFVLDMPEHSWIKLDKYVYIHFQDFLERIPLKSLKAVFMEKTTFFRLGDHFNKYDHDSQSFNIRVGESVKELMTKTHCGWATALLTFETALILQDSHLSDDEMETLVDADKYVCELGYIDQIEEYLHSKPESVEKMVRLSFISAFYFSQEENQVV